MPGYNYTQLGVYFVTISMIFTLSACTFLTHPIQETDASTPFPETTATDEDASCAADNWKIGITSVEQLDLDDGTKLVIANIGIENNDMLWGSLQGPIDSVANETNTRVSLMTKDGSLFENLDSFPTLLEQQPDRLQALGDITGRIKTPLLPPGFVTLGKSIDGEPRYYNFAFQLPKAQIPDAITIGGLEVNCILPYVTGGNGAPAYHGKKVLLPERTYNLSKDVGDVHDEPSARRYPNLVGAELELPDWKEVIEVTGVTREGDRIKVTFDFTNYSSHPVSPSFNGYLIGSSQLFYCPTTDVSDCGHGTKYEAVQPGQTAQDLTWSFTVPEEETDLVFVYVYGGLVDLNEVYRVNLE